MAKHGVPGGKEKKNIDTVVYYPETVNKKVPDLEKFVETYLPDRLPMNWHHRFFYDLLSNKIVQQDDGLLYLNDEQKFNKEIVAVAPRFHAKSQAFTRNYPLWEIYKNPNVRIIIVSANEDIAVSFNRAIINQLENNEKMINELGFLVPEYPKRWGEKALIVHRPSMEKDPTVAAIGLGGKMISKRADIIIADDIIDLESARTPRMRQKTLEWWENVLLPILEDNGRVIIAGTIWYKSDIYDTLLNNTEYGIRVKLKALVYHSGYFINRPDTKQGSNKLYLPYSLHEFPQAMRIQDLFSEELVKRYQLWTRLKGGVLWEEKWSFDKLMEKRSKMSSASFMRQYLNEPMTEEEKLFKEQYLKEATDKGGAKTLVADWDNLKPHYEQWGHLVIAVGVDLAISKRNTADKSAIAVWGLTDKRERVLLYIDSGRWSPEETKQRIIEIYHAFKPVKIRVENVAFQDMLRQELENDEMPIEGFHTSGTKKYSEETGLAHIAMLFEQGKVIIPGGMQNTDYYKRVAALLYQMSIYTDDQHAGDELMASWFAIGVLREFDAKLKDNKGFFSNNALVEHLKNITASRKIVLLGNNPPVFRFANNSLLHIFRPVEGSFNNDFASAGKMFFTREEKFMIFATRAERSVAYIFEKRTDEIVGKIEGNLTALAWVSLLEKTGRFFNNAQIVHDRNNEGQAIYMELQKRNYPNLTCMQPDKDGYPTVNEGIVISSSNLPLAVDYFKGLVDGIHVKIPDDSLLNEMAELISVEEDNLITSFGSGQRIKTVSMGLWLLDNYETSGKKMYNNDERPKKTKFFKVPYRVFKK